MSELSRNHWSVENYRQRMTSREWKEHLLAGNDVMFFGGLMRHLVAKSLGCGVVEVYKKPLASEKEGR